MSLVDDFEAGHALIEGTWNVQLFGPLDEEWWRGQHLSDVWINKRAAASSPSFLFAVLVVHLKNGWNTPDVRL